MNRIVKAIARTKAQVEASIAQGIITAADVEETRKALDIQCDEYTVFQDCKSIVNRQLTADEAITVYEYLGEAGPNYFNGQPIEVKVVLIQLLRELLARPVNLVRPLYEMQWLKAK